jgi:hypothetical protein
MLSENRNSHSVVLKLQDGSTMSGSEFFNEYREFVSFVKRREDKLMLLEK